jgi:2-oxoglutarate dehydrogenase E1 component
MSPKSLLRHKRVVSDLQWFEPDWTFHRVLYCDQIPSDKKDAKQVVLCSGKVYYDLLEEREKRGVTDVHFLRLEQIYPFPADALAQELEPYKHCHLVWCQEEPRNMGAWPFASTFIEECRSAVGSLTGYGNACASRGRAKGADRRVLRGWQEGVEPDSSPQGGL